MDPSFVRRTALDHPVDAVEAWHRRPGALHRLLPPWEPARVVSAPGPPESGAGVELRFGRPPFAIRWLAEHRPLADGRGYADVQVRGPFSRWIHEHVFRPRAGGRETLLEDRVEFRLPGGPLVNRLLEGPVRRRLERSFRYRHRTVSGDLRTHLGRRSADTWRVAVTGSSGLVGTELVAYLRSGGHHVVRVTRGPAAGGDEIGWDPDSGLRNPARAEGLDAVVHLAAEPLPGLWTEGKKRSIVRSREEGTRNLVRSLRSLESPPETLISTSAVGYYGDRGEEPLTEDAAAGEGFLADVCRRWEAAARRAEDAGIRVVRLRLGVVMSGRGGALPVMLPAFRLGLGGSLGDGRQWMSWVAMDDVLDAVHFVLDRDEVRGPVNVAAPGVVRHGEFVRTLGRALSRPVPFRVPESLLRALPGELVEEMLLASQRVQPEALTSAGFSFRHPELEGALRHQLGRFAGPGG